MRIPQRPARRRYTRVMLRISERLTIPDEEIELSAIRASGPGGQNVNKVASAIHLRFDIEASSALDEDVKARLLALSDRRISAAGVVVIKAQRFRNLDRNREDALARLADLIRRGLEAPAVRKKTRPPKKSREKRLEDKARRAKIKALRKPAGD